MERLYPDSVFRLNDNIENWKAVRDSVLRTGDGSLFLIDETNHEPVEAKILFWYSTLIYSGFNCRGIVTIGNDIGTVFVDSNDRVYFKIDNELFDSVSYNKMVKEIVEALDDDCKYSEAIHARSYLNNIESMHILVKQYHAMQRRNNNPNIPYTEHLNGVASVLETIANKYNEIPDSVLSIMIPAALGHDLLEDTFIKEDRIDRIDTKVLQLLLELTNPNDDAHTDEYMKKIASASEEARLIKYADLIENTSSVCYSLHEAGIENPIQWAKEFYIPILTRSTMVLSKTIFDNYPKTADALRLMLNVYTDLLINRIELLESV